MKKKVAGKLEENSNLKTRKIVESCNKMLVVQQWKRVSYRNDKHVSQQHTSNGGHQESDLKISPDDGLEDSHCNATMVERSLLLKVFAIHICFRIQSRQTFVNNQFASRSVDCPCESQDSLQGQKECLGASLAS